jgi:hypothetical protein
MMLQVRVLKLELPPAASEAGIRTFARGGEWERAASMFEALLQQPGHTLADQTLEHMFDAFADAAAADRALGLLQVSPGAGAASGQTGIGHQGCSGQLQDPSLAMRRGGGWQPPGQASHLPCHFCPAPSRLCRGTPAIPA